MKKLAIPLLALMFGSVFIGLQGRATQVPEFPGDEAARLMTYLLRHHPYIFEKEQLDTVEELYRQFRELESRGVPDWHGSRQEMNSRLSSLAERMLGDLPRSGWMIPVPFEGDRPQVALRDPIQLPGEVGVLIFKLTSGPGEVRFTLEEQDLSALHHDDFGGFSLATPLTLRVPERGTTWGVVGLKSVPQGRTTLTLRFQKGDRPPVDLPFHVSTPEFARLRIGVLSDDDGRPAPSMIQMSWNGNDTDWKPPNAIDLGPQFDARGTPTGHRPGLLPGDLGGRRWWCVPGPFQMMVPPGKWKVVIRRGIEHTPVRVTLEVSEGGDIEQVFRPRRWVDMRESGWYSGDDHVHAQLLSDQEASNLMDWIRAEGIHVANIVKMGDIFRTYFEQRGFGPDFRVLERDHLLSPGQEGPRTHDELGHTLAMNIRRAVRDPDRYFLYDFVFDAVHAQGGLTGYAHVVDQSFQVHRDMSINVPKGKVDFVELMQFGHLGTELYYDFLNLGFKLTASAGSDVPWGGTVGEVRVYAHLGDRPFSAEAWFQAVEEGRTFVTNGPMIDFQIDGVGPGDELRFGQDESGRRLSLRARAWRDPVQAAAGVLQIVRHGRVIGESPVGAGQQAVELSMPVEVGEGSWMAARFQGNDGTQAHTTPIYIVRQPLRFWDFENAETLLGKRLSSLAEVEEMVRQAGLAAGGGESGQDYLLHQLARQGPELMARVEEARSLYRELGRQLKKEAAMRGGGKN